MEWIVHRRGNHSLPESSVAGGTEGKWGRMCDFVAIPEARFFHSAFHLFALNKSVTQ